MGIINRFLLFFYGLAVGLLSVVLIAACTKLLPEHVWGNELKYLLAQQEAVWTATAFLVMSFYFVVYSFFFGPAGRQEESSSRDVVLVKGNNGDVRVSLDAVCNVVEREARAVALVRDVKVHAAARGGENPLGIDVQLVLLSGANVASVSGAVVANIKERLRQALDFPDVPVKVLVADISNAPVEKRRVV